MERILVHSEMVKSVGYDFAESTLEVEFAKGPLYRYKNVPPNLYELLMDIADTKDQEAHVSFGTSFHYLIRIHPKLYPYEKVSPEPEVNPS